MEYSAERKAQIARTIMARKKAAETACYIVRSVDNALAALAEASAAACGFDKELEDAVRVLRGNARHYAQHVYRLGLRLTDSCARIANGDAELLRDDECQAAAWAASQAYREVRDMAHADY